MRWFPEQSEQTSVVPAAGDDSPMASRSGIALKRGMRGMRSEEGQSLVIVALSLTVLMGFVAFATDIGVMLRQKRVAQSLADSAAIAAAYESLYEGTPTSVTDGMYSAASHDVALNGFTPATSNGTTNTTSGVTLSVAVTPNLSVAGYNSAGNVQATVALKAFPIFSSFFGLGALSVNATAIASNTLASDGCVYVTDYTGDSPALSISTGNNSITTTDCSIEVTGDIDIGGSSDINAGTGSVNATGSITGVSKITANSISSGAPPADTSADPASVPQSTADKHQCKRGHLHSAGKQRLFVGSVLREQNAVRQLISRALRIHPAAHFWQ